MSEIQDYKDYALSSAREDSLRRLGFGPQQREICFFPGKRFQFVCFGVLIGHTLITALHKQPNRVYFTLFAVKTNSGVSDYKTHTICHDYAAASFARKLMDFVKKRVSWTGFNCNGSIVSTLKTILAQSYQPVSLRTPRFKPLWP